MKVKFSKTIRYTPEWNDNHLLDLGNQITFDLSPMDTNDILIMMDAFQEMTQSGAMKDGKIALDVGNIGSMKVLVERTGDFISKYTKVHNLFDSDDSPVTAEDIVKFPFYMELSAEVLAQLAVVSMPSEEDEKNSVTQLASPSLPTPLVR
jgi:hypothetical protein